MTHRTEYQPTPIEKATRRVLDDIDIAITQAFHAEGLDKSAGPTNFTEPQFRRLLAMYFHDRTYIDWANLFGVPIDDTEGRIHSQVNPI